MSKGVTKDQWIAMFRQIGLSDEQMKEWHQVFEAKNPEGHQAFLEWLSLEENEVKRIRRASTANH